MVYSLWSHYMLQGSESLCNGNSTDSCRKYQQIFLGVAYHR